MIWMDSDWWVDRWIDRQVERVSVCVREREKEREREGGRERREENGHLGTGREEREEIRERNLRRRSLRNLIIGSEKRDSER